MKIRIAPLALLALSSLDVAAPAQAGLIFTFQRVSDTKAIMTATGTATDPGIPGFGFTTLYIERVVSRFLEPQLIAETGDFAFGSNRGTGWKGQGSNMSALSSTLTAFSYTVTDVPRGTAILDTSATGPTLIFAPIGSTGAVRGRFASTTGFEDVEVGRWTMTQVVPEPSTLTSLTVAGVAGLAGAVWRRRKGTKSAISAGA